MIVPIYATYLIISILITVWVGHTLHSNGRIFLVHAFKGDEALADSVNHLLLVGFYLLNFGFICLTLNGGERDFDLPAGMEFLSGKLGTIVLILGGMHFTNMFLLSKFRKCGTDDGKRKLRDTIV